MKKVTLEQFIKTLGVIKSKKELGKLIDDKHLLSELLAEAHESYEMLSIEGHSENLKLLKRVIELYPNLHIVSSVFSDSGNEVILENELRIVNRDKYFLATKGKNKDIYSIV